MSACQEILIYFLAIRLSQDKGYHVGGPQKQDHSSLGSIFESLVSGNHHV